MTELFLRLLVVLRFLCFMAVVYLGLHVVFSRLISKRDSKVLWFFSIITSPLTRPIRQWLAQDASEHRIRVVALVSYGLLWALIVATTEMAARALR